MPELTDDDRGRLLQRAEAAVPDDLTRKVADAIRGCIGSPEVGEDELEDAARAAVLAYQRHALEYLQRIAGRIPLRSNHYAGPVCGVMLGSTCSHPLGHRGPCDIPEDDPAPASTGVPRCPGEIWTTSTDQMIPCTLPLGHHGGCR